jgi:hypothetical protein
MICIRKERSDDIEVIGRLNEKAFGSPPRPISWRDCGRTAKICCPWWRSRQTKSLATFSFRRSGLRATEKLCKAWVSLQWPCCRSSAPWDRLAAGSRGRGILTNRSCPFVIVLGHPEYYPRFGFERASLYGIRCRWEGVPDEAFMIRILDQEAMRGASGRARYQREFDEAI